MGYFVKQDDRETWMQKGFMTKKQCDELAFSYGKSRKLPKQYVERKQIECNPKTYLVDYMSLSAVTLDKHKNRYLLNTEGYHRYGLVCAKNVIENRKYAMFVEGTQLTEGTLLQLKVLVEKELGYKVTFVTDNRHRHSKIAEKSVTMWIECEFGGLKTKLYKDLRQYQKSKGNRIFTDLTLKQFLHKYLNRLRICGVKLLAPYRINQLTKQKIIN